MWKKLCGFLKQEIVLTISAVLAVASCFLVPPDAGYLEYLNADTLIVLFCLMAVMAGLKDLGVFQKLGESLLRRLHGERSLVLVLVALCFFSAMLITNDVALITFVPLAILILDMAGREGSLCLTVTLMTIAANLGSMLTPIGNPQNLYLYAVSGLSLGEFFTTMFPYALLSALLLAAGIWFAFQNTPVKIALKSETAAIRRGDLAFYLVLFGLCLLTVAKVLSVWVLLPVILVAVAVKKWRLLLQVDYCLLATFVCFFVFIGNMGRFDPFQQLVLNVLEGHVLVASTALSQVISNVPAALLLSGFTQEWKGLLIGVNLGGLGTLIASMASLISYKQIALRSPEKKGRYLLMFTLWNVGFLALLLGLALVLT